LSARIATGASIAPRRHFVSQGAAQTRPQIDGKGFGRLAMRYASAKRPWRSSRSPGVGVHRTGRAAGTFSSHQRVGRTGARGGRAGASSFRTDREGGRRHGAPPLSRVAPGDGGETTS
jgi:hypothetical protein